MDRRAGAPGAPATKTFDDNGKEVADEEDSLRSSQGGGKLQRPPLLRRGLSEKIKGPAYSRPFYLVLSNIVWVTQRNLLNKTSFPRKREPSAYETILRLMLSSRRNGTLYIGVTSDLKKRVFEHKNRVVGGFTSKYNTDKLVWHEIHEDAEAALTRERRLKKWVRSWKKELI